MNSIVPVQPSPDSTLRRARFLTLGSLAVTVLTSLVMPGIGVLREQRPLWIALGTVGTVLFAVAQAGALYATVTPWLSEKARRRLLVSFGVTCVLTLVLVGPVGGARWESWAWVCGSIAGSLPMLK